VSNGEVTLPGSLCPSCTPNNLNAIDTWLPLALAELLEGIGGGILSLHSQSTCSVFHTVRLLKERGKLSLLKGIIIPEGAGTDLAAAGLVGADFDSIPFLLVNGARRQLLLPVSDNYFCRCRGSKRIPPTTWRDSVTKGRLVAGSD
jgi:hypothetical protein